MKYLASLLLIMSFVGIGIFGLEALDHSMRHGQSDCVASIVTNTLCPVNLRSIITHHFAAIQSFFNVPISTLVFSVILLIAVSIIGPIYLFKFRFLYSQFITQRSEDYRLRFNLGRHKLISWIALFELSPSF